VPSEIGSKTASKYFSHIFDVLRNVSSEGPYRNAIALLDVLIHSWARAQSANAIRLVKAQKISWGEVAARGTPFETKREGKKTVKKMVVPPKPSASAWAHAAEQKQLSAIYTNQWKTPDDMCKKWKSLTAEEQHDQFKNTVHELKEAYAGMTLTSQTVMSRLGRRKGAIMAYLEDKDLMPTKKQDRKNVFALTQVFFKHTHHDLKEHEKVVFSPAVYLQRDSKLKESSLEMCNEIAHANFVNKSKNYDTSKPLELLVKIWDDVFHPKLDTSVNLDTETIRIEVSNKFEALDNSKSSKRTNLK
jgi:hypothetical protein